MQRAIIFFLIPAIITLLGIIIINASNKPEVVHLAAAYGKGTGYRQVPEQYTVTASSHYKWHHGGHSTALIIVGYFLFLIAAGYAYDVDAKAKKTNLAIIGVLWFIGILGIFGKYAAKYYEGGTFSKTISGDQYEQNKSNLDAIFLK